MFMQIFINFGIRNKTAIKMDDEKESERGKFI